MAGTAAYRATRVLRDVRYQTRCAMCGTDIAYAATRLARMRQPADSWYATGLRACYEKPGTDTACGTIGLRVCYAKPSTDTAYRDRHVRGSSAASSGRAGA
eukprot:139063-Rhodomonas_salina.2